MLQVLKLNRNVKLKIYLIKKVMTKQKAKNIDNPKIST